MSRLRIGVVSQWYEPEHGSVAVVGAICRALAAEGHEVHVLTGFPHYPTGSVYPGYRLRPYEYEQRGAVHVHRVPMLPSHDRSAVRRAATYLSFSASGAAQWGMLGSVDAWLVFSSPATAAVPAMAARALHRRPYVLLVQDLWPETVLASGFLPDSGWRGRLAGAATRGLRAFCDAAYHRAAHVAVTAPGMVPALRARGVPAPRVSWVPNWVDESLFRPAPPDPDMARMLGVRGSASAGTAGSAATAGGCGEGDFVVMYAGSLGDLQGLETAVDAVRLLSDLPGLRLVFAGSGVAEQRLRQRAADLPHVHFLGQQPTSRMPGLLALGDVQLVSLRDLPLFATTLPSKVQATLAAGRPVVAAAPGDAARVVTESGAGEAVPPGDPAALAAALRRMYARGRAGREALGRAGHAYYHARLSARTGAAALSALVRHAAGRTATSPDTSVPGAPPTREPVSRRDSDESALLRGVHS